MELIPMSELQYTEKPEFYDLHNEMGQFNRSHFYRFVGANLKHKKLLDLGCGQGTDLAHYKDSGAEIFGVDINSNAIQEAKKKLSLYNDEICCSDIRDTKFQAIFFDIIVSHYVIQIVPDLQPVYKEVARVLKPHGRFVFLVTHPFRQYFEKKNKNADYFEQETVNAIIFNQALTVREPTHTLNDYFSDYFLDNFKIKKYTELNDPTAEKVDCRSYPGFFIIDCEKL